ncbi:unnamed protein product [Arctogadus glacialis]
MVWGSKLDRGRSRASRNAPKLDPQYAFVRGETVTKISGPAPKRGAPDAFLNNPKASARAVLMRCENISADVCRTSETPPRTRRRRRRRQMTQQRTTADPVLKQPLHPPLPPGPHHSPLPAWEVRPHADHSLCGPGMRVPSKYLRPPLLSPHITCDLMPVWPPA